jgi:hypothetical protein
MGTRPLLVLLLTIFIAGGPIACGDKAQSAKPLSDRSTAKKVADSFMANLVANQVGSAVTEMEGEFIRSAGGKAQAEIEVRKLFDYCGRPLDSEFKHDETGSKFYLDGRKKPMMKFYYSGATTLHAKGECFFAVEVVPGDDGGQKVTTFGPLKLMSGDLPSWLR